MRDSAKGIVVGFIFQFEKALILLASLNSKSDEISIEEVDDVAVHDENHKIILTVQAKHSILPTGETFKNGSYALWRTLEIWITKKNSGVFDDDTKFICCSNKKLLPSNLLCKLKNDYQSAWEDMTILVDKYKEKIDSKKEPSSNMMKLYKTMEYVMSHFDVLKSISLSIDFQDQDENLKEQILNRCLLNSTDKTQEQKDLIYNGLYGWLVNNCKTKWKNGEEAIILKEEFDTYYQYLSNNHSIIDAIFRTKRQLQNSYPMEDSVFESHKDTLFVQQISDLISNKDSREHMIRNAVIDYFYSEIELGEIARKGKIITKKDLDSFIENCFRKWEDCFYSHLSKSIEDYTEDEKIHIGCEVYNEIMKSLKIEMNNFIFNDENRYIQNGTFLNLSNMPRIGWHPNWKQKYSDNE